MKPQSVLFTDQILPPGDELVSSQSKELVPMIFHSLPAIDGDNSTCSSGHDILLTDLTRTVIVTGIGGVFTGNNDNKWFPSEAMTQTK